MEPTSASPLSPALLRRATEGDPAACRAIVEAIGPWLFGMCRRLCPDVRVDVDGRARIIVEPAPGVVREGGQDNPEEPMDVRMVGAALGGVVVTVGVLYGTALVQRPGASPAELAPGHPETFGGAGGAAASAATAPAPAAAPGDRAALQGRVAALEAELAEARAALDAERFTGELVRGQLTRLQGVPSEWPDHGVPEPLRPANFEASVQEQLGALEGIALDRVSCEEYPCIAVVRHTQPVEGDLSEHDDWDAGAQDALRSWLTSEIGTTCPSR